MKLFLCLFLHLLFAFSREIHPNSHNVVITPATISQTKGVVVIGDGECKFSNNLQKKFRDNNIPFVSIDSSKDMEMSMFVLNNNAGKIPAVYYNGGIVTDVNKLIEAIKPK